MAVETWSLSTLTSLKGQNESSNLEFKSSPSLANGQKEKRELCKDVSAMANAAGGTIVYGITEKDGAADEVDGGIDPSITAEWIDQVLTSNIEPKIADIRIQRIPIAEGRNAFALEIPQATTFAPHQNKIDQRYWARRNTTTEPLLDHEIRDLMRRGSTPVLFLAMNLRAAPTAQYPNAYFLSVVAGNHSSEPALYWALDFTFDDEVLTPAGYVKSTPELKGFVSKGVTISNHSGLHPATMYSRNFGVPDQMPLFKEREFEVFRKLVYLETNHLYPWSFTVACPGFKSETHGDFRRDGGAPSIKFYKNGIAE